MIVIHGPLLQPRLVNWYRLRLICALVGAITFMIMCGSAFSHIETPLNNLRVIDGDTILVDGHIYRLIGFDAPETGKRARCANEARRGKLATLRLRSIVKDSHLSLERVDCSCSRGKEGTEACNYGRSCGLLRARGRDVAEIMIAEGLARSYICRAHHCPQRSDWCSTNTAQ